MSNFTLAMMLKPLIFGSIVFALWLLIPAGKVKATLFKERPWNIWAWIVSMSLLWFVLFGAAWEVFITEGYWKTFFNVN